MSDNPYNFDVGDHKQEMILRDHLAVGRTVMANETSFLAYIRTALTLAVAGVSLLKFFNDSTATVVGWIFLALAAALILNGALRYEEMDSALHKMSHRGELEEQSDHSYGWLRRLTHAGSSAIRIFFK